jgi:NAD(P)-dependent dehydrogenase (short-subunit alcohol dehydrogenase family)
MSSSGVSLEGKKAIVTGGKRGIGRGIALALAAGGADVVVCSRGEEELRAVASEIRALGRRSLAIGTDVSRKVDVQRMVERVVQEFGGVDILVNAAGVMTWGQPVLELSEDVWDQTMEVNLKGSLLCSQAVGKEMVKQKSGTIINITSIAAHLPVPNSAPYCVTKAGLVMFTRVLALEMAPFNVRVNAISPGWIKTEMNAAVRSDPAAEEAIAKTIPSVRWGEPEDIAKVAVFLASDLSGYVTGQTISVDGDLVDGGFFR